MSECDTDNYSKFCKDQFTTLFSKNDEVIRKLENLNNKLFIDNGAGKSLVSRIREIEYKTIETANDINKHLEEQSKLKRNWSDVFYTLVKNALWAAAVAAVTYFLAKT